MAEKSPTLLAQERAAKAKAAEVQKSKDRERRQEKLAKQRAQLRFMDPGLSTFPPPESARSFSAELARQGHELRARADRLSEESKRIVSGERAEAEAYVQSRGEFVEDQVSYLKNYEAAMNSAEAAGKLDKPARKRVRSEVAELERTIVKERAALAGSKAKLEFGIIAHRSHHRLGDAYLDSLIRSFEPPHDAQLDVGGSRDRTAQPAFRAAIFSAYKPPSDPESSDAAWCPVTKQFWGEEGMKAAHIVPYAVGETQAAHLLESRPIRASISFGRPRMVC